MMQPQGVLYIVSTPIGHLKDVSLRALEILNACDRILVEDTRHSAHFLNTYGIHKPLSAFHDHNERAMVEKVISYIRSGEKIALISDAGTPLVSDPGFHLVKALREQSLSVVPIPGACALVCALSASGLPTDSFLFSGFLSAKRPARLDRLRELSQEKSTLVFYESPHRIIAMLEDACDVFGVDRLATVARELTKQFETVLHGSLALLLSRVQSDSKQTLGEFVVCIEGYQAPVLSPDACLTAQEQTWLDELMPHIAPAQLAQIMARQFKQTKKRYYSAISKQKHAQSLE